MLSVPEFVQGKNALQGKNYLLLVEFTHSDGTARFARYDTNVTYPTVGGQVYTAFPIGEIEVSQGTTGELPAYDIPLSNVGREIQSILENSDIESYTGKLIWVDPDQLADATAKIEETFVVVSARADARTATITVSPVTFDPLGIQLPLEVVTLTKFPGVVGARRR